MTTPLADDPWKGANPIDPAFRRDPYPALARLREIDPVNATPFGVWRLTRYDDVLEMLRHPKAGVRRSDGTTMRSAAMPEEFFDEFMLQRDPPAHTRLRRLVSKAFTPRAIERLRPRIEEVARAQVDAALARGSMDAIADLALPVPATMICEMMGVPASDRDRFTDWTARSTHLLAAPFQPPDVVTSALAAAGALRGYFEQRIAERRGGRQDDLLGDLIAAEEEGDRLSPSELLAHAAGLLVAGFETTIGLIGNGLLALIRNPDQAERLRARPELLPSAIDECLRFDGPIILTVRIPREDVEIGGKVIPKDTTVMAMLAAANRDPAKFPDPDRFDVARRPNEHLAFGGGVHFCLGSHLARMEAEVAIGTLVARTRNLRLAVREDELEMGASLFRVLARLPIAFDAA
jgi:cytochrome P450